MINQKLLVIGAFLVPFLGNVLSVCVWLPLLEIPPGTPIRPMAECSQMAVTAVVTLWFGGWIGGIMALRGQRVCGVLCVGFSLVPIVVGGLAARIITDVQQLIWAD